MLYHVVYLTTAGAATFSIHYLNTVFFFFLINILVNLSWSTMQHVFSVVRFLLSISKSLLHVYPCISMCYVTSGGYAQPLSALLQGIPDVLFLTKCTWYTLIELLRRTLFSNAREVLLFISQIFVGSTLVRSFSHLYRKHGNTRVQPHTLFRREESRFVSLRLSELLNVSVLFP